MNDNLVLQQRINKQNQKEKNNVKLVTPVKYLNHSSDSDRNSDKKVVDMMKLIKKNETSRVSEIDIFQVTYGLKRRTNYRAVSRIKGSTYNLQQNLIQNDNNDRLSAFQQQSQTLKQAQFDDTFLSHNDNSIIIGFLFYLSFIVLITTQVIGTVYFIEKQSSQDVFYFENALLTILSSQLIYYIIARFIDRLDNYRLFKNNSPVTSYKKLMVALYHKHVKVQRNVVENWIFSKPYLILVIFSSSVIICQLIYSWLATSSNYLLSYQPQNYMISSIFWSYFALPFLFTNFYWNRPIQTQNYKIKLFPFLILTYMLYSFFQGYLFPILIIFRLIHNFIKSKQQLDGFHLDQLNKVVLLLIVIIFTFIKEYTSSSDINRKQLDYLQFELIWHVGMLTITMIISRIIASKYIKQHLYKYYYTEMHINMAYIYATLMLYLSYLSLFRGLEYEMIGCIVASIVIVGIFGWLVYMDGREKMIITMEINLEQNN